MSDVPVSNHVEIFIVAGGAAPEVFDFGTLMLMHELDATVFEGRFLGPFSSTSDLPATISSALTPDLHADIVAAFSQQDAIGPGSPPGVGEIFLGRKLPSTASTGELLGHVLQVDDSTSTFLDTTSFANSATPADWIIFPATEEDETDFMAIGHVLQFGAVTFDSTLGTAGTDGTVLWEYGTDTTGDGLIDSWTLLADVVDGTTGFTIAVAADQDLTFTIPSDWSAGVVDPADLGVKPARYYIRARVTDLYTIDPVYDSAYIVGDASWTVALDKLIALEGDDSFFGFKLFERTDAVVTEGFAWAQSQRLKWFIGQTRSPAMTAGSPSNIGEDLRLAGYRKGVLVYENVDAGHLDTAWAARALGTNMDATNGKLNWKFLQVIHPQGPAGHLSVPQQTAIKTENANFYGTTYGFSFLQEGTTPNGEFADNVIAEMWLGRRLEEKGLAVFVSNKVIGYDSTGLAKVEAGFYETLTQWVTFGHGSADSVNKINLPKARDIASAVKQTRILTFDGQAFHKGGVNKISFTLNVEF